MATPTLTFTYATYIPDAQNSNFPNGYTDQEGQEEICVDWTRRWYYTAIYGTPNGGIEVTSIDTMDVIQTPTLNQMFAGTTFGVIPGEATSQTITSYVCSPSGGNLYLAISEAEFSSYLYKINPSTMQVTGQYQPAGGAPNVTTVGATASYEIVVCQTSSLEPPDASLFFNGTYMVPIGLGPEPTYGNGVDQWLTTLGKVPGDGTCQFIQCSSDGSGTSGNIDIFVVVVNDVPDISFTQTATVNVSSILGASTNTALLSIEYDSVNDWLILGISTYIVGEPQYQMSVNYNTGAINWYRLMPGALTGRRSNLAGGTIASGDGTDFTILNTTTGAIVFNGAFTQPDPPVFSSSFYRIWDSIDNYYFSYALAVAAIRYEFSPNYQTIIGPPPAYLHFLTCCDRAIMAHLYQFTSATGEQDYFTDFDISIFYNNITWKATSLRFEGLQRKLGIGTSVDEQSLKIWASPTDTMFGSLFLPGAEQGLLDGAVIVRQRIIWEFVTGNVAQDILNPPLFVFTLFTGYTSQITKGGVSHVEMKVKSALLKLNVNMPRNYFQPGCLWTLYDQGCGLAKASFAANFTVTGSNVTTVSVASGTVQPSVGGDGNPQFAQGRLLFNSGPNAGLQVLIDTNDASNFYLAYPLDQLPNNGDSITVYPGCSKSFATCQQKFNNAANFRGFDKVPPVFISM